MNHNLDTFFSFPSIDYSGSSSPLLSCSDSLLQPPLSPISKEMEAMQVMHGSRKRTGASDQGWSEELSPKSPCIQEETPFSEDTQSVVAQEDGESVKVVNYMGRTPIILKKRKVIVEKQEDIKISVSVKPTIPLSLWYENPQHLVDLFVSFEP